MSLLFYPLEKMLLKLPSSREHNFIGFIVHNHNRFEFC